MEETRPGVYLPISEDERGSYILNSKDLCLLERVPELVQAGLLEERYTTGKYGAITTECVRAVQRQAGIVQNGIANLETRMALRRKIQELPAQ